MGQRLRGVLRSNLAAVAQPLAARHTILGVAEHVELRPWEFAAGVLGQEALILARREQLHVSLGYLAQPLIAKSHVQGTRPCPMFG